MGNRWKLREIVLAAVIAVVCGAIYTGLDLIYGVYSSLSPQLLATLNGGWWIASGLAAFIIRRPGAAFLAELIGGVCELTFGGTWGWAGILAAVLQGLGAELAFAVFAYRSYNAAVVMLSGALGAVGNLIQWYAQYGGATYATSTQIEYILITIVSGIVLAGVLPCLAGKALKRTGALRNYGIAKSV